MLYKQNALSLGTLLNDEYRILQYIGHGGFSITYLAEHISSGTIVLVKELFNTVYMERMHPDTYVHIRESGLVPSFSRDKQRLLSEWEIMNIFKDSPGFPKPIDYFESNSTAYIIMEHLSGGSLNDNVRKSGPYNTNAFLTSIVDVLESLDTMHEQGYIHRDISPDNLVMDENGKYRLIDFGAVIKTGSSNNADFLRKEGYTPAEAFSRQYSASIPSDIYSLCAVLYYAYSGRKPEDSLERMMIDELRPLCEVCPGIDPLVNTLVMKGLSMNPEDRWQSIKEIKQAIHCIMKSEDERDAEAKLKIRKKKNQKRILAFSIFSLALLIIALFCFTHKELVIFKNTKTEKIVLYYPEELSTEEKAYFRQNIQEKIEHITESSKYLLKESPNYLEVTLPYVLLEKRNIPIFLNKYFNYSTCCLGAKSNGFFYSVIKLNEDSIDKIIQNETGCTITLNPELSTSLREKEMSDDTRYIIRIYTKGTGNHFWDLHNQPFEGDYYDINVIFDANENQISINDSDIGDKIERMLFIDCITKETAPLDSYNYERHIIWETRQKTTWGKYQKDISQIQGNTTIFIYSNPYTDYLTENIFQMPASEYNSSDTSDLIKLKKRLDSLQIIYACGWNEANPSELYIATQSNRLWEVEAALLFNSVNCFVKSASGVLVATINADNPISLKGTSICVNLREKRNFKKTLEQLLQNDDQILQLCINDRPVLQTKISDISSDNRIMFKDFILNNTSGTVHSIKSFAAYINALISFDLYDSHYLSGVLFVDAYNNIQWRKDIWSLAGCETTELRDLIYRSLSSFSNVAVDWNYYNPSDVLITYYLDSEKDKQTYEHPFVIVSDLLKTTKLTNEISQISFSAIDRTMEPYSIYSMEVSKISKGSTEINWSVSYSLRGLTDKPEYSDDINAIREATIQYLSSDDVFASCIMTPSIN